MSCGQGSSASCGVDAACIAGSNMRQGCGVLLVNIQGAEYSSVKVQLLSLQAI
jgi:hypothetical protein